MDPGEERRDGPPGATLADGRRGEEKGGSFAALRATTKSSAGREERTIARLFSLIARHAPVDQARLTPQSPYN